MKKKRPTKLTINCLPQGISAAVVRRRVEAHLNGVSLDEAVRQLSADAFAGT